MDLTDFINHYFGKKVDFDGAYGAQCVDLFRMYCKEVLALPHTGAVDGAKDLFLEWAHLPLERYFFYKVSTPECGDVVIWGETSTNKYGHVAIFISKINKKEMLVFEQDGFKQDGAKFKLRKFENVLGYLRKKGGEK